MSMTESEYTNEELIDFMYEVMDNSDIEATPLINEVITTLEEIQQYRAIGTVSEFRELKEKATAKKPIVEVYAKSLYERKTYRCPSCNHKLISKIDGGWCGGTLSKNCEECGTALDWSKGKE